MDALPAIVREKLDEVRALCEKYRVKKLVLFGSAIKENFDPGRSDIDFLVEFLPDAPGKGFGHSYFPLREELEELFRREVDLVEPGAITNPYVAESIRRDQLAVYDAA